MFEESVKEAPDDDIKRLNLKRQAWDWAPQLPRCPPPPASVQAAVCNRDWHRPFTERVPRHASAAKRWQSRAIIETSLEQLKWRHQATLWCCLRRNHMEHPPETQHIWRIRMYECVIPPLCHKPLTEIAFVLLWCFLPPMPKGKQQVHRLWDISLCCMSDVEFWLLQPTTAKAK